jgi:hypothetical protein
MLKAVSSITNAIGALNFKGTWDANANSPALASSVGTKGDYYVVGTAGSTNLNGISNWGVGDLATFNGSVWQRVEGGADLNGVNLSVSGTSTLSGLTASTALALNASKEAVSVTNTGTGNNVLATSPTLVTPVVGAATGTSLVTTNQVTSQKTATTTKIQSVGLQTYFTPGNSTTFTITPASGLAWAFVISEGSGGGGALVFCSYANTTINIVSSSVGGRSFVASNTPTASQLGIFKSANDSVISFVTGSTWGAAVAVCLLGDYLGSVTDPV